MNRKVEPGRWSKPKVNPNIWYCQRCGKEQDKGERHEFFFKGFMDNIIFICDDCYKKVLDIKSKQ
jgi:hypothetical protein